MSKNFLKPNNSKMLLAISFRLVLSTVVALHKLQIGDVLSLYITCFFVLCGLTSGYLADLLIYSTPTRTSTCNPKYPTDTRHHISIVVCFMVFKVPFIIMHHISYVSVNCLIYFIDLIGGFLLSILGCFFRPFVNINVF